MTTRIKHALIEISYRLDTNLTWAVTGSANIGLKNGSFDANDIDIICTVDVFPGICLSLFSTKPSMERSFSGKISSIFCEGAIKSVNVQLMSNVFNFVSGEWIENEFNENDVVTVEIEEGLRINCASISYEARINKLIANSAALSKIRRLKCFEMKI